MSYMIDTSSNSQLTEELSAYLANNHPVNAKRESKVVADDIKLQFKYWQVPTLGQRADLNLYEAKKSGRNTIVA